MFKGVPKNIYNAGIESFNKIPESYNLVRICFFFRNKSGSYDFKNAVGGCHSAMSVGRHYIPHDAEPLFIVTAGFGERWKRAKSIGTKRYIPWLINESPWADVHLLKDIDIILKSGYHMDCDVPDNYLLSACITARHSWEVIDTRLKDWEVYVEKFGWDPTVALLFRYNSFLNSDGNVIPNNWGGHNAFATGMSMDYYKNIYNKVMPNARQHYTKTKTYANVDDLWSPKNEPRRYMTLFNRAYQISKELKTSEVPVDTKTLKLVNPFIDQIKRMEDLLAEENKVIPANLMPEIGRKLLEELRA